MADLFPEETAAVVAAHAEQRAFERDYTPRPVAAAVVDWLLDYIVKPRPEFDRERLWWATRFGELWDPHRVGKELYVLDTCAGAGVWASEMRRACERRCIPVRIVAVEINPDEVQHLRRHADIVHIGDWREQVEHYAEWGQRFDLVIGNPAFSQARAQEHPEWTRWRTEEKRRRELRLPKTKPPDVPEYVVETSMPAAYMRIANAVALYTTQQSWTKTESGFAVRMAYPPAVALDIPGSISHRVGKNPETGKRYSADSMPYSSNLWISGAHNRSTETFMLPPIKVRSWKADLRPGAEPDEWLRANGIPTVEGRMFRLADGALTEIL